MTRGSVGGSRSRPSCTPITMTPTTEAPAAARPNAIKAWASPARSSGSSDRAASIWSTPGTPIQKAKPHHAIPRNTSHTCPPTAARHTEGPTLSSHQPGRRCRDESLAPSKPKAALRLYANEAANGLNPSACRADTATNTKTLDPKNARRSNATSSTRLDRERLTEPDAFSVTPVSTRRNRAGNAAAPTARYTAWSPIPARAESNGALTRAVTGPADATPARDRGFRMASAQDTQMRAPAANPARTRRAISSQN